MQYQRFSTNLKSRAVTVKNSFFVFIPTTRVQSDPIKMSNPVFELVSKLKQYMYVIEYLRTISVVLRTI